MFQHLQKFVTTFRELEKKEPLRSQEEEEQWKQLKEKLSAAEVHAVVEHQQYMKSIAVASLYPRVGASFIASNFAFYEAARSIRTTLCENPIEQSYFYFALDCERRKPVSRNNEKIMWLMNQSLQIKVTPPYESQVYSQAEAMNWFFTNQKHCSFFILDFSSHWRGELASWLFEMVDQIWFVIDPDFPRLSQTIFAEEAPENWKKNLHKISIIANKWNEDVAARGVIKRIEGTLSQWDEQNKLKVGASVPRIDANKLSRAQLAARIFLEMYPDEGEFLDQLSHLEKGRVL